MPVGNSRKRSKPRWRGMALVVFTLAAASAGVVVWAVRPAPAPSPRWESIEAATARQDWPTVERQLVPWLVNHPDDGKALLIQAALRLAGGQLDHVREPLRRVRPDDPAWPRARLMLGELAITNRETAEAERLFRSLAANDPGAVPPRQRLVYLYSLQLRTAEARAVLWEIYRSRKDPNQLADLVLALFQVENDVRGLGPELEESLELTPADPWLRRAWGLALHWRGRQADALPHLEAASAALDHDLTGRFALAECRHALGLATTETDPVALLGPRPDRPPADAALWCVFAARLAEAGDKADAALALLRQAVAANPNDREAHFRLGRALARHGDAKGSKDHLDRAEAIRKRDRDLKRAHEEARAGGFNADRCERLGTLCRDAGLASEARAWFELALSYDPARASARAATGALPRVGDLDALPVALARPVLRGHARIAAVVARPPAPPAPGVRFEDVAARSGLTASYDSGATGDMFIADTMGGGVGLIDADDDGRLDVYLVNGCRLPVDAANPARPNRLFRNKGDGTFEDVTARAGVGGVGYGMGCAVGDYDDDGHDDLFVTGLGRTVLYHNKGDGTFEDVTARAGVNSARWTTAAGFGDLDGDGDLDLVAVTYVEADPKTSPACRDHAGGAIHCSPGHFPAQADHLFRNNGDGTFTDVGREAGFDAPDGRGLGLAVADLDGDGRLDLFVANDASPNFFFRNLGGLKFEEVGMSAGVACDGSGRPTASMGVVAADLDGDGRLDLFHTNFLNEPNTLRLNLGGGQFRDATLAANLDAPSRASTGFGAAAIDADGDGRLDLFVANGHVDDQPWVNSPMAQRPQLFLNRGANGFVTAGPEVSAYLDRPAVGRGVAAGDLDDDGREDLVVVHRDAPVALLRNTAPAVAHWFALDLRGTKSGRTPVGAKVTCRAGGQTLVRWVTSGTGYLSSSDRRLIFGLGPARTVERLEVRWPSGLVQSWSDLAADGRFLLEEGGEPLLRRR